ncbi:MAG: DUF350 domain-containing protein, partial [Gammaproteobacteria bacterium]
MHPQVMHSLSTLPNFLMYFAMALALTGLFLVVYLWITPHDELKLVRENKEAAAISFCGALLGFILPLATAIAQSDGMLDCLVWGLVALVIQSLTFLAVRLFMGHLSERIA